MAAVARCGDTVHTMLLLEAPELWLIGAIFAGAGLVKGMLGMGLPTFAMGFLGLWMPVPQAAALLTLPALVTNLWQAFSGGALRVLWPRIGMLQLGIAAGVAGAAWLLPAGGRGSHGLLGACLLLYGAVGLVGWRTRAPGPRLQRVAAPLVGLATGVVTALTGVFVLPLVPYLQALQLDRHQLTQALGVSFTTSTIALAAMLAWQGHLDLSGTLHSALSLVPALAGMLVGQKLRDAMSEALFSRCFFAALVLLGVWLVVR